MVFSWAKLFQTELLILYDVGKVKVVPVKISYPRIKNRSVLSFSDLRGLALINIS